METPQDGQSERAMALALVPRPPPTSVSSHAGDDACDDKKGTATFGRSFLDGDGLSSPQSSRGRKLQCDLEKLIDGMSDGMFEDGASQMSGLSGATLKQRDAGLSQPFPRLREPPTAGGGGPRGLSVEAAERKWQAMMNDPEDRGVVQKCIDRASNPSGNEINLQVEKAASAFKELEDEEPVLVSFSHSGGRDAVPSATRLRTNAAPKMAAAKPKSRAREQPVTLLAARSRASTAKSFAEALAALRSAEKLAKSLLEVTAPKVLGEHHLDDPSLTLIRSRLLLVQIALRDSRGSEGHAHSRELYERALEDPYIRELQTTTFASEDGVMTIGMAQAQRDTGMDLQPSATALDSLVEKHRNAIACLKTIGSALTKESESWKANVVALQKMKESEEKAMRKVEEKEMKAQKRAEEKRKKQEDKDAAKKKKKEAEAGAADDDDHEEEDKKRSRKRRTGGHTEISESDPPVLREMSKFSVANIPTVETVSDFLDQIANNPRMACVARLKKGMFKKEDGSMSQTEMNNAQKVLIADGTEFADACADVFKLPTETDTRKIPIYGVIQHLLTAFEKGTLKKITEAADRKVKDQKSQDKPEPEPHENVEDVEDVEHEEGEEEENEKDECVEDEVPSCSPLKPNRHLSSTAAPSEANGSAEPTCAAHQDLEEMAVKADATAEESSHTNDATAAEVILEEPQLDNNAEKHETVTVAETEVLEYPSQMGIPEGTQEAPLPHGSDVQQAADGPVAPIAEKNEVDVAAPETLAPPTLANGHEALGDANAGGIGADEQQTPVPEQVSTPTPKLGDAAEAIGAAANVGGTPHAKSDSAPSAPKTSPTLADTFKRQLREARLASVEAEEAAAEKEEVQKNDRDNDNKTEALNENNDANAGADQDEISDADGSSQSVHGDEVTGKGSSTDKKGNDKNSQKSKEKDKEKGKKEKKNKTKTSKKEKKDKKDKKEKKREKEKHDKKKTKMDKAVDEVKNAENSNRANKKQRIAGDSHSHRLHY
eukprot:Skav207617  [mRNA]  locus=scaffold1878:161067:167094:+ [translate_table: standard]